MPALDSWPVDFPSSRLSTRRQFLKNVPLAATLLASQKSLAAFASAHAEQSASTTSPGNESQPDSVPDYRIEIAEIDWELAPKKKIRTTAYSGQIPGPLLRVTEGKPVTIEIVNRARSPGNRPLARPMDPR